MFHFVCFSRDIFWSRIKSPKVAHPSGINLQLAGETCKFPPVCGVTWCRVSSVNARKFVTKQHIRYALFVCCAEFSSI